MCTVSWVRDDDSFQLLCNRDEKRTRRPALAPVADTIEGVTIVAPRDGDYGGTWIAVNEYGVAVTVLNGANGAGINAVGRVGKSRGHMLLKLATARTAAEVCERAWRMDLGGVAPFMVAVLALDEPAAIVEWTGEERAIVLHGEPFLPLASSSYDAEGVRLWRQQEFDRLCGLQPTLENLRAFHRSHRGEGTEAGDAYSTCMHRADAETVSFSSISVTASHAELFYSAGAPCQVLEGVRLPLALRS